MQRALGSWIWCPGTAAHAGASLRTASAPTTGAPSPWPRPPVARPHPLEAPSPLAAHCCARRAALSGSPAAAQLRPRCGPAGPAPVLLPVPSSHGTPAFLCTCESGWAVVKPFYLHPVFCPHTLHHRPFLRRRFTSQSRQTPVRNLPRAARHATYGARSPSSAGQIWLVLAFPRRVEQGQSKVR